MTTLHFDSATRRSGGARKRSGASAPVVGATGGGVRLGVIGLLLGVSAAAPGVAVGSLRLWYVTSILALVLAVAPDPARITRIRPRLLDLVAVAFLVVSALAELLNSRELGYSADYSDVIAILGYLVGYLACRVAVSDRASMSTVLAGFAAPAIPSAILGIGQAVAPGAFRFVTQIAPSSALADRYDSASLIRATGLVGIWTGFGYYLACVLVACAVILATHPRSRRRGVYAWTVLAVSLAGIGGTLTFGTIGVAAVVVVIVLIQSSRPVLSAVIAVVVGAIGALLFGAQFAGRVSDQAVAGATVPGTPDWVPNTFAYRLYIWVNQTIPAIAARPVTGWGSSVFGGDDTGRRYPSQIVWPSAESQYLSTGIGYGVVAAILFGLIYLVAIGSVLRAAPWTRSSPALPMVALSVAALLAGVTFAIVSNRGFPGAYWPLLGAILAGLAPTRWGAEPEPLPVVATEPKRKKRRRKRTKATVGAQHG